MPRLAFILPLLLLLVSAAHAGTGFRETTLSGKSVDHPMHVSIWYPTASDATPVLLGETPAFIGQPVIKDAEPTAGPHPLVVLSHGYGGSWRNLAWLAADLVDAGYVVAAPDHPGMTTFDMRKPDAVELWKRPGDLSRVIDALLDNPDLSGGVASDRIAAIGHSLGGWTVVELAGGRFDAAKVANVRLELSLLEKTWREAVGGAADVSAEEQALHAVNERLWVIEDDIRVKEKAQAFDAEFIRLARAVYFENDERARIKKEINLALGSAYVEEKSYQDYRTGNTP